MIGRATCGPRDRVGFDIIQGLLIKGFVPPLMSEDLTNKRHIWVFLTNKNHGGSLESIIYSQLFSKGRADRLISCSHYLQCKEGVYN